ncbi:type II toxin-antitoxin system PemK/MazF family toxin [Neorhizobium alkalisoli]|uniref:PemK-like, MazF-like toxin of type II toxin-antitoxin system n=1 Tax=Neorhizobium alkalisoli TaxID=528178 RepID=A0A561QNY4_9HYPH|nr:type II toxin-antitoxin system PemK/MazF family toxin [Neorhizobium alkalisoli]TWF52094.1 PemK-like, MazF-like toxin of type II toxin-antitoxin system [Neorhizobium alkalisoli]
MALDPKPGLVIRYDFLWKEEEKTGLESGKDRPCSIVLISAERADGAKDVLLCAITHTPPASGETAVKIPIAVARHLGFDDMPSWIKTDQVNLLKWEKGRIPHGVSQVRPGEWFYGMLPRSLGEQAFNQVREKAHARTLRTVRRDDLIPPEK